MKANIHPQYFENAQVICVCGNRFAVGSTVDTIHVELCSKCHPFFTGEERFVDSRSVIQRFKDKQEKAKEFQIKNAERVEKKKKDKTEQKSLRDMLLGL